MPSHFQRSAPGPGQEAVWDYPRPPRLEPTTRHIQVIFAGLLLADTRRAWRVLETSHPPVYYLPPEAVHQHCLRPSQRTSFCEFKGTARYFDVIVGQQVALNAAWSYPRPEPVFAALRGHLAFYAQALDACLVDGERVTPQPGNFYGGWITRDIAGPFKGAPGTHGW